MRNVIIDNGQLETNKGFAVLGSSRTLGKVTGIFPYGLETGAVYFMVTDSSVTLETQDFKNWTFVSSGSNSGAILNWFQVRNKMWGVNGIDFPITWDHATKTILNGSNGTPAVPKFRYGDYYQDRVFGFNLSGAASDLAFTSVITTDNVIIAPDDSRAWPALNLLHVGQGDGQIGTALWIYGGRLRAGKERSIYTIFGDNPSNYNPIKEEGQVGVVSDESVAMLDQKSYWLGQDGVFENSSRISDLINPDIDTFQKAQSSVLSNTWETQADFSKGQFNGTTATPAGLLQLNSNRYMVNYNTATCDSCFPITTDQFTELTSTGITSTNFAVRLPTDTIPSNYYGYISTVSLNFREIRSPAGFCTDTLTMNVKNLKTNQVATYNRDATGGNFSKLNFGLWTQSGIPDKVFFNWDEVQYSSLSIQLTASPSANCIFQIFRATITGFSDIELIPSSTAQYVSDIATETSVTAWGNFDSVNNTNGGNINYYYRSSTSVINITTQTWQSVNPGVGISAPLINRFIQYATTLSAVTNSPTIDNVSISHVEGQASIQRPIAIDWNNRYWLSVSTLSDPIKREIYIKSKITNKNPNAWMVLDGIDVCGLGKYGSVLYGGSCSTGVVYRLDYGTNYNGSAIASIYSPPQMSFGDDFFDKNIMKYLIQGTKNTNGVINLGSSVNEGTVTNSTFSINGSGFYNRVVEGVRAKGKTLDLTVSENDLDQKMILHNVSVVYEPTQGLSNK